MINCRLGNTDYIKVKFTHQHLLLAITSLCWPLKPDGRDHSFKWITIITISIG